MKQIIFKDDWCPKLSVRRSGGLDAHVLLQRQVVEKSDFHFYLRGAITCDAARWKAHATLKNGWVR